MTKKQLPRSKRKQAKPEPRLAAGYQWHVQVGKRTAINLAALHEMGYCPTDRFIVIRDNAIESFMMELQDHDTGKSVSMTYLYSPNDGEGVILPLDYQQACAAEYGRDSRLQLACDPDSGGIVFSFNNFLR
jgi:hypothetical protein